MPRDYQSIVARLNALTTDKLSRKTLGVINSHPVHCLRLSDTRPGRRRILLSAGIHGDEPAGPEAVLRFLERHPVQLLDRFDFTVVPCINPHGYIHNTRANADNLDLNRSFQLDALAEVTLIKNLLQGQRFDLFMEFHEDWEYEGYYLFELTRDRPAIGPAIIDAVRLVCPIHPGPIVDGMPIAGGIVQTKGEEVGTTAMPLYIHEFHSDHVVTCESPSQLDMETRVDAHLTALDTALDQFT